MVIVVSKPPNAYLALLYQKALLVVYPSLSEGFGFPLLEAWGFKIPIVTSNSTCIPEIADDAAAYFNPMRFEDIAETLERVIESKDLREELIRKGIKRLQNYSWQKSATEHLQLFINTAN